MNSSNEKTYDSGASASYGATVSSFDTQQSIPEPTYEPYRPPPVLAHERINPFDKNVPPSNENKTSSIYSTLSTNIAVPMTKQEEMELREEKPVEKIIEVKIPTVSTFTSPNGFDYSYKAAPLPTYIPLESIEKTEPIIAKDVEKSEPRHKFERKMSDADIIFGSKPEPYTSSFKVENYSRNRSNSSFTSTSTEYAYGIKNNSFQKSLSVSSDKDGDFSNDPAVLASRNLAGTPKSTTSDEKLNYDVDDDYDLK